MLEALDLSGKVAIVTGGGTGLGREVALRFANAGADLVLAGRREGPIRETAEEVQALGKRALAISTDVADSSQVDRLMGQAMAEFGQIDILINNAGSSDADDYSRPIWEISDEDWRSGIDTNLSGAFYCSRALGQHMTERGYGKIVNISSGFGFGTMRGLVMYSVAKAGLIQLTRVLAMYWARSNINVNCIAPGLFATTPEEMAKTREERAHKFIPIGYAATATDLADLVLFLSSDASSYIMGETIVTDGGALVGAYAPWGYEPSIPLAEA
ncbi:MAG: SDR family NAD(P)-dependent oxidoreductase [Dehalococcoidia bacterium]